MWAWGHFCLPTCTVCALQPVSPPPSCRALHALPLQMRPSQPAAPGDHSCLHGLSAAPTHLLLMPGPSQVPLGAPGWYLNGTWPVRAQPAPELGCVGPACSPGQPGDPLLVPGRGPEQLPAPLQLHVLHHIIVAASEQHGLQRIHCGAAETRVRLWLAGLPAPHPTRADTHTCIHTHTPTPLPLCCWQTHPGATQPAPYQQHPMGRRLWALPSPSSGHQCGPSGLRQTAPVSPTPKRGSWGLCR